MSAFHFPQKNFPLQLHAISVGYGDAFLIQWGQQGIFIDTGELDDGTFLTQYLSTHQIKKISAIILTHPHKNHFGGAFELLKKFQVEKIFTNGQTEGEEPFKKLLEIIQTKQIPNQSLKRGDSFEISPFPLIFKTLHPEQLGPDTNNNSLVLKMSHQNTSVLFTGDIGIPVQKELIKIYPQELQSNIVTIPHHGGPIDSEFARYFKNSLFLLSTGENPWGLPYHHQIKWFQGPLHQTDTLGSFILQSNGKQIRIVSSKKLKKT